MATGNEFSKTNINQLYTSLQKNVLGDAGNGENNSKEGELIFNGRKTEQKQANQYRLLDQQASEDKRLNPSGFSSVESGSQSGRQTYALSGHQSELVVSSLVATETPLASGSDQPPSYDESQSQYSSPKGWVAQQPTSFPPSINDPTDLSGKIEKLNLGDSKQNTAGINNGYRDKPVNTKSVDQGMAEAGRPEIGKAIEDLDQKYSVPDSSKIKKWNFGLMKFTKATKLPNGAVSFNALNDRVVNKYLDSNLSSISNKDKHNITELLEAMVSANIISSRKMETILESRPLGMNVVNCVKALGGKGSVVIEAMEAAGWLPNTKLRPKPN